MAPNNTAENGSFIEQDAKIEDISSDTIFMKASEEERLKIVWENVIQFSLLHLAAVYGAYLFLTSSKWQTDSFAFLLYIISVLGVTAGAHRLWTHRAYKAKWPLRLILIVLQTVAFQGPVIIWARDHRLHHKYSETDADPHNSNRGIFFSHIGWLLCQQHPEVQRKGKDIDLSDLYADPILRFQKKYYTILMPLACFIIPTIFPVYFWKESWSTALFVAGFFRHMTTLNVCWLINSVAHKWGNRPYDKNLDPADNFSVSVLTLGEGYHNYHHLFPWDYKTAELGCMNFTTHFINLFSKIGWAYELKTVSDDIIKKRVMQTGDGSHALWGWGDMDQPKEELESASITNRKGN